MATKDEVRERIAAIGTCKSLRTQHPDHYNFFFKLFQNHPHADRKRVAEIVDIFIQMGYGNTYQMGYSLSDGTKDTISWNTCVTGTPKPPSSLLTRAMRTAILAQMYEYKDTQPKICVLCGATKKLTVDHFPRKFRDIKQQFLDETKRPIPTEFGKLSAALDCFCYDDYPFQREWELFHESHASYRILCLTCNMASEHNGDISSAPSDSV